MKLLNIFLILFYALQSCKAHDSGKFFTGKAKELADAIATADLETIERLATTEKVDLQSVGNDGMTFLIWCFETKQIKSMQKLLELGADPNFATFAGIRNPIYKKDHPEEKVADVKWNVIGFIVKRQNEHKKDYSAWLELLIKYKADLCKGIYYDHPSLHITISSFSAESPELLFYLLDNGADINCKDKYGYTALWMCANTGLYDVVLKMIERGADVDVYVDEVHQGKNIDPKTGEMEAIPYKDNLAHLVQNWSGSSEYQLPFRKKVKDYLRKKGYVFPYLEKWEEEAGSKVSYEERFK